MRLRWLFFKLAFLYPRIYGFFCYYRKRGRRREIEDKFKLLLGERWTSRKSKEIVRHIFELRGSRKVMRYVLPCMDHRFIKNYVRTEGREYLDTALGEGRGVVLMAGHFGNFYLGFHALRVMGYELFLVRGGAPKQPRRRRFRYTESVEDTIFFYDLAHSADYKRRILEALRSGKVLIYYGDGREGRTKETVPFLGGEIGFPSGMVHFAREANAAVIPFIHLYRRGRITLIFKEPIDRDWKNGEGEYKRIIAEFAKCLETYLLTFPEQYAGIYGPMAISDYCHSQ